jgi:hypothetical protein
MLRLSLAAALLTLASACATAQTPAQLPPNNNPIQMNREAPGSRGPVRNLAAQPGEEIVTIRYFKIKKGTFPQFLEASQKGVWPFFEKIGARIVGMWQVIPPPDGTQASPDYDEVYLTTRYASLEHWAATRDAAALGGDGPDYAELQKALDIRRSLTLETKVTYLKGAVGPLGPVFMPGTAEKFVPAP